MGTSDIVFTNLDVRGEATAGNYMSWPLTMWRANKRSGFQVDGNQISVVGNRLTGVQMGILTLGNNALVEKNIIDGFSGDGMRALGDNSIVRGNKIQNCFKIDANHDDGFQSFSRSAAGKSGQGVVMNLTLEDNKIFEWASSTTNPLRCKLQGIGMFDGMYDGVTIRNNVISVSAYHGISIAGALNTVITNNTVINASGVAANYPWIKINAHKNGTPPKNVLVANNLVSSMKVFNNTNNNVVEVSNMVVKNASAEFTSLATQDFTLKPTAKAANSASPNYAPPFDIMGVARPRGSAPDMGAYESQ
ncbi:MAG: right-handed parallel beta-helix repeat-containing protein [Albidovulum sp.]